MMYTLVFVLGLFVGATVGGLWALVYVLLAVV